MEGSCQEWLIPAVRKATRPRGLPNITAGRDSTGVFKAASEESNLRRPFSFFSVPILKDYLIHNFSTNNAPPSQKVPFFAIEFFINHRAITPIAFHESLPINSSISLRAMNPSPFPDLKHGVW